MISAIAAAAYELRNNGEFIGGGGGVEGEEAPRALDEAGPRALDPFETSLKFGAALVAAARLLPEVRFPRWSIVAPVSMPERLEYDGKSYLRVAPCHCFDAT